MRSFAALIVFIALAQGCVATTKSSRVPISGQGAPGTTDDSGEGDGAPANQDKEPDDEDDGRLIVTGDDTPVDANGCTPSADFYALRAHAVNVDAKRVLWIFAGASAEKSAAISTCVDGKFAFRFIKPLADFGDTPSQPWTNFGKIYIPYLTNVGTQIVTISSFEGDVDDWKIERKLVNLPEIIVGTLFLSPHVMLFTEPSPQSLRLHRLAEDLSGSPEVVAATFPGKPLRGLSIRPDLEAGKWMAVFSEADQVSVARATEIAGPWSEPKLLHKDDSGLACGEATDLPMFTKDPAHETVIAFSCANKTTLQFARVKLPKD